MNYIPPEAVWHGAPNAIRIAEIYRQYPIRRFGAQVWIVCLIGAVNKDGIRYQRIDAANAYVNGRGID